MCFFGQIFWAKLCDMRQLHEGKEVYVFGHRTVLVVSSALSVCTYLSLNAFKHDLLLVFVFVGAAAFCRAGPQGIQDSLTLSVLKQYPGDTYGSQRLFGAAGWGSMALLTGAMIDIYGTDYMFYAYSVGTATSIAILFAYFP